MIKVIMFIHRQPGLSFEEFRHHYEHTHVPLALSKLSYLRNYVRNYFPPTDESVQQPCDCISELWFEDLESLKEQTAAMSRDGELQADEHHFIDRARTVSRLVDERISVITQGTN